MNADPIELLQRLRPAPGWAEPTDLETDVLAASILDRVLAGADNVVSLDAVRRRRRAIGITVVVAAGVTGGVVAAVWNRAPSETRQVACWSAAVDPPPRRSLLAWDGVNDPTVSCAAEWAAGRFGEVTVPPILTACVTAAGATAVIPGEAGVCGRLGLAESTVAPNELAIDVVMAQQALDRRFNGATCQAPELTASQTRQILDDNGLDGWTVSTSGRFSEAEPCASVALDPETTTAFVRPVPRQG